MSGTIGQPDAGSAMTGGNFSLTGGFWSLVSAVQTPGAPRLTITRALNNSVEISWPSPSTGWRLEQNANLGSPTWEPSSTEVSDDGTHKRITINPPAGHRFYRLHKP